MLSAVNEYQDLRHIIEETATLKARKEALEASQDFILIAFHYSQRKRGAKWRPSLLLSNQHIFLRICLDFTGNKFYVILFGLFEALFTIFTLFVLANRPLFAATKQCKSAQKYLSTKLEIKSKQILKVKVSPIGNPFSLFCWSNSVSFS